MNLVQWARRRNEQLFREAGKTNSSGRPRAKRGAYMELCRASGVSYVTVLKAARDGLPVQAETAEKLSDATGSEVPVAVIRAGVPSMQTKVSA